MIWNNLDAYSSYKISQCSMKDTSEAEAYARDKSTLARELSLAETARQTDRQKHMQTHACTSTST